MTILVRITKPAFPGLLALAVAFVGATLPLPCRAHVGSADVFYEGDAGPYRLYVTVLMPQVIPGIAEIQVRSASAGIHTIAVVPMRLAGAGSQLAPTPDVVFSSPQDPQAFHATLWIMESGALQVHLTIEGNRGSGELSVPVPAFARRTLRMNRALGAVLFLLMLLLGSGLVAIVAAAVREGSLRPGEEDSLAGRRRARGATLVCALILVAGIVFGNTWWNKEARRQIRDVDRFRPPEAETTLESSNRLVIRARHYNGKPYSLDPQDLLPDHGHLMHLFLLSDPGMDRMFHLHPEPSVNGAFAVNLPAMPAGRYRLFADVVDGRGFPWTLISTINLTAGLADGGPLSGDDSSWSGEALHSVVLNSTEAALQDGSRITWRRPPGPLKANLPLHFKFAVESAGGNPVYDLEPYMGMRGHAEFVRSDFSVFAHVHPAGSVAMAALDLAQGAGAMPAMDMSAEAIAPELSFPYGFPQPGRYRIFVQVKRHGQVLTGVFDTSVN